jgi:hypothetical protein
MNNALEYLIGDLQPEEVERFEQWKADDAGCDLIAFMPDSSHEQLIWAVQEVYLAERDRQEYLRRMEAVKAFSLSLKALLNLPHWID